jgi:5-methylcytosine-specific restriction endonuclease McrA
MKIKNYTKEFSEAVRAVLSGQDLLAESALRRVEGALVKDKPRQKNLPLDLQLKVFTRDDFTCRFCGKPTIFLPIMLLLSFKFPLSLAYRERECHLTFMRDTPSCDYLNSLEDGGERTEDNLLTVCYSCHQARENFFTDTARWIPKPLVKTGWDGLVSHYQDLCFILKTGGQEYFFDWLKAVNSIRRK